MAAQIDEHKRVLHPDSQKLRSSLDFSRRIPELDGLRGLAIGMVVFMHYVWWWFSVSPSHLLRFVSIVTRPFWSAVDLFFVLSGFLIGGNLLDARTSHNYFSTFYIRRFCRVLPIYLLLVGLVGLSYHFVYLRVGASLDWMYAGRIPWYAYLSFAQNFWMAKWNEWGATVLAATWAFAVELQFYLIAPAIIRFVRRSALPYLFIAGFVIAPIVRTYLAFHFPSKLFSTYVLLPSRMDSLFLGLLCAYSLRQPEIWNWLLNHRRRLWIVLLILLSGIPPLSTHGIPYTLLWVTVGYGWMAIFYATILILAVTNSQSFLNTFLCWSWLRGFGTISYGVYLFHPGIYLILLWAIAGNINSNLNWMDFGIKCLAMAGTITFASLSWRYFEKPIVRWSHKKRYSVPAEEHAANLIIKPAKLPEPRHAVGVVN
jgi:peptidoglycan/LPS O-acetylase OafA/YrhL